ncbi:MAG: DUF6340 family protein [Bacteroidia bacterium]|nr:DUF6340 family protein [Bacteroidia bacterium]
MAASCSQSVYILDMESRGPSESGLDLAGKSVSVVYLESADGTDSLYNNRVSDALAYKLETEYFDGREAVSVYNMVKDPEGDYSSKDTLSQFIMMLDKDVVMLLDTPEMKEKTEKGQIPVSSCLYVYDSMSDGEVVTMVGKTSVASMDDAVKRSSLIGGALASPMISRWVSEQCALIYYDDAASKWMKAIELADEMKWAEAIEIWMEYAKSKDAAKASSAKYNIAYGCYILEQYDLALEWLKSSDDSHPLSLNQGLRTRIQNKMKK